eukprot:1015959-Prymnesium_polylepis.1
MARIPLTDLYTVADTVRHVRIVSSSLNSDLRTESSHVSSLKVSRTRLKRGQAAQPQAEPETAPRCAELGRYHLDNLSHEFTHIVRTARGRRVHGARCSEVPLSVLTRDGPPMRDTWLTQPGHHMQRPQRLIRRAVSLDFEN